MISYYDIRAARTAMRALQNKPLRRRKLDIHFSIPKVETDFSDFIIIIFLLGFLLLNLLIPFNDCVFASRSQPG